MGLALLLCINDVHASRQGRDVLGLYPGQLGRLHTVHAKDCGVTHTGMVKPQKYQPSFDLCALRALTVNTRTTVLPSDCGRSLQPLHPAKPVNSAETRHQLLAFNF
ncbi:hypothetical protein fugu_007949 [Takifugu bimaculatus]|uniref:Uncharacterized protein n=1 Tax=Takifugu bimaculatus TaxID=433685 RepID=A0A4Z2B280_9TELE|nr:hypothetical protein fugu_007949 [Takifugu bimaculatus]